MGAKLASAALGSFAGIPAALPINAQTAAGYSLTVADTGFLVTLSHSSAQNLTIPLASSQAMPIGATVETLTTGAGTWTVTPTGGVTYTGPTSLPTGTRLRLTKTGTDTWYANTMSVAPGLVYVGGGTVSAGSAINVNNCFSAAYENYRIELVSNVATTMRLRVGGADNSTANYANQYAIGQGTGGAFARTTGATSWSFGIAQSPVYVGLDVYSPFASVVTAMHGTETINTAATIETGAQGFIHNVASSFDGFSLLGTTMTATVRVYAYSNY